MTCRFGPQGRIKRSPNNAIDLIAAFSALPATRMTAPTFLARSLTELIALRAREQPDDAAVHTGAMEFGEELQTLT